MVSGDRGILFELVADVSFVVTATLEVLVLLGLVMLSMRLLGGSRGRIVRRHD